MGGPKYRYSPGFKSKVVQEIVGGELTVGEAKRRYDISYTSLYRWLRQYGQDESIGKVVHVQTRDERAQLKQWQAENHALEHALAQAQVQVIALEALLAEVEARTGLTVKKWWWAAIQRGRPVMRAQPVRGGMAALCAVFGKSRQAYYTRTQVATRRRRSCAWCGRFGSGRHRQAAGNCIGTSRNMG